MMREFWTGLFVGMVLGCACIALADEPPRLPEWDRTVLEKAYRLHEIERRWAKAHPGVAPTAEERRAMVEEARGGRQGEE